MNASRGHPLFRHWAGPQLQRMLQTVDELGASGGRADSARSRSLEPGHSGRRMADTCGAGNPPDRPQLRRITYMVPLGVSAAAAVSVGHAVGAGDPARARRAGWLALALGTGFMLCAAVVFLVAPRRSSPSIPAMPRSWPSARPCCFAALFQIFDGIQTVSTGALRGLGETRVPMWANLVGYWVSGSPTGPDPLLRSQTRHLRPVDRPHPSPGGDCFHAAGALEPGFAASCRASARIREHFVRLICLIEKRPRTGLRVLRKESHEQRHAAAQRQNLEHLNG